MKISRFPEHLTVDFGTFPLKVMFLLAFSLATLILCVGAIVSWRYQLVIFDAKEKICFWRFTMKSWLPEVSGFSCKIAQCKVEQALKVWVEKNWLLLVESCKFHCWCLMMWQRYLFRCDSCVSTANVSEPSQRENGSKRLKIHRYEFFLFLMSMRA